MRSVFLSRFVARTLSLACLIFQSVDLPAAVPENDACTNAFEIPAPGPFPYLTPLVDVREATTPGDPPLPPCVAGSVGGSVWYRFTPGTSGTYTISTCTDTATTLRDTVMAIYTGTNACGDFSFLRCSDDECGTRAAIAAELAGERTYYVVVWTYSGLTPEEGSELQLRISPPPPVTNDTCAGVVVIPSAGPFPYVTPLSDTRLAGTVGDPPAPGCGGALERSVWYQFTPAASGIYNLSVGSDSGSTIFNSVLALYEATSCAGPFSRIACDEKEGFRTGITTNLVAGRSYYIVAWDPDHTTGESILQLRVNNTPPRISSGMRLADGRFALRFDGNLTQQYTVEGSLDLLNWSPLGVVTYTNAFIDNTPPGFSYRFYRLRSP